MKFKLVEEYKELTSDIILQTLKDIGSRCNAKSATRAFLLPDGSFISNKDTKTSHAAMSMFVEEQLEDEGYDVSKLSKDFLEDLGCVHVNKAEDNYILLPNIPLTKKQCWELEDWINVYFNDGNRKIGVVTINKGSRTYSFPEFDGEEIVDNIKKFYVKGILENINILTEDVESVRKNYPKISDEDFNKLIRLDPTFNENRNSVGTYGKWILNLFNKGKLDNIGHVKDLLTRFEENKKYLLNKDINKFKSLEEVDDYLNNDNNYKEKSHRQEVRDNQKARKNADVSGDFITSIDGFDIYIPSSYENSCKLGQGARWCTASTESDYYYNYYKDEFGGDYYILINQINPEEKYQFHFESMQFMDKDDYSIQLKSFFKKHPNIEQFFKPVVYQIFKIKENGTITVNAYDLLQEVKPERGSDYLSGEDIYNILFGDGSVLFDWFYDDGYSSQSITDLQYEFPECFNEENRKNLESLGVKFDGRFTEFLHSITDLEDNGDDIEDALLLSIDEGCDSGAAGECYNDCKEAITNAGGNINFENNTISFTSDNIYNDFLDNYDEMNLEDYYPEELVVTMIASGIQVAEPYYGWTGFDVDAFNDRLGTELYERFNLS